MNILIFLAFMIVTIIYFRTQKSKSDKIWSWFMFAMTLYMFVACYPDIRAFVISAVN